MTPQAYHIPVLLQETLNLLHIVPDGVYVDCTFGGGGHSKEILNHLNEHGRLIAFDQDPDAHKNAFTDARFTLIDANFRHIKRFLRLEGIRMVDGILADLGVSSHQFDTPDRGFSLRFDAPLDMRMNPEATLTAAEILNNWPEDELAKLILRYGELPHSRRIAKALIQAREKTPILTTGQLNEICKPLSRKDREHQTLARIYQALRIEVNQELDALKELLLQSTEIVKPGGRLVVISYHSLEDKLVKVFMRSGNFDDRTEKDFFGNDLSPWKPILKKAIEPTETEVLSNSRSRSARLRAAIRTELS